MDYKYIFGPVPSRRLGMSLGVDLIPPKTCTYNCIYCECGKTTDLTTSRKEYVPLKKVISELGEYLKTHPGLDYITYSGSGEPTLHTGIREITEYLKANFPEYKIALLTNGSLLWDKKVRNDCKGIDVVIPSLDSALKQSFEKIDRPHSLLDVDRINEGISDFSRDFSGEIWLEIFIVPGINDTDQEIDAINSAIKEINPAKVQLNTLDRPGIVEWIKPADDKDMERIAKKISCRNVEITKKPAERLSNEAYSGDVSALILQTVQRRPCTLEDIAEISGLHINEINKYLGILVKKDLISESSGERGVFYSGTKCR